MYNLHRNKLIYQILVKKKSNDFCLLEPPVVRSPALGLTQFKRQIAAGSTLILLFFFFFDTF